MRAAVVEAIGRVPVVEEIANPMGDDAAEVVAAALNPFVVAPGFSPTPRRWLDV